MRRSRRGGHVQRLVDRLRDGRGRRVVFLSHCLLNENTRYLGGACVPDCRPEVLQRCLEGQLGVVQLPYSRLARQVAAEVADYLASGMEVSAIVGVDGSPTCGVRVRMPHGTTGHERHEQHAARPFSGLGG